MEHPSDLEGIAIFVEVAREQSFTSAARKLNLSKSQVSKQIGALEDRLNAQLLVRTTRTVRLTETGRAFHERCSTLLAELDDAERMVSELHATPSGRLRVNAPMSFGQRYLGAIVSDFMAAHSALRVDLELSDHLVDLMGDGYDLAIRIAHLPDSSLVARKLAPAPRFVCASPDYLARRGRPSAPQDLVAHTCLRYTYQTSGEVWRFEGPKGEVAVHVDGSLRSNNGDLLAEAACAGAGIALLPSFIATPALRSGHLVRLLEQWRAAGAHVYAVYPPGRHLSAKVRLFVDHLARRFATDSPWMTED